MSAVAQTLGVLRWLVGPALATLGPPGSSSQALSACPSAVRRMNELKGHIECSQMRLGQTVIERGWEECRKNCSCSYCGSREEHAHVPYLTVQGLGSNEASLFQSGCLGLFNSFRLGSWLSVLKRVAASHRLEAVGRWLAQVKQGGMGQQQQQYDSAWLSRGKA
jgi:hypothetical protein